MSTSRSLGQGRRGSRFKVLQLVSGRPSDRPTSPEGTPRTVGRPRTFAETAERRASLYSQTRSLSRPIWAERPRGRAGGTGRARHVDRAHECELRERRKGPRREASALLRPKAAGLHGPKRAEGSATVASQPTAQPQSFLHSGPSRKGERPWTVRSP